MKKLLLMLVLAFIGVLAVGCNATHPVGGNVPTPTSVETPTQAATPTDTATPTPVDKSFCNVADYKGKGGVAIQRAIDDCEEGGTVFIPAGTYNIAVPIMLKPNITVKGEDEATVLVADREMLDMFGDNKAIMQTLYPDDKSKQSEQNIVLDGITFDGDLIDERKGNLLDLSYAENVTVKNCIFRNNRRIALALGASKNITVSYCTFENNGLPAPQPVSTPAIWTDKVGDLHSEQIFVYDCLFQNNNWSGCYFFPQVGEIARCRFIDNHESAIFTTGNGRSLKIIDNYITSQRCSNISANGIEVGTCDVTIEGNFIRDCDQNGISFTNCNTAVVRNNMVINNGNAGDCAGIFVFALVDPVIGRYGTPVSNILIEENIIGNSPSTSATQAACLGFWKQEGEDPIKDFTVRNNVFGECKYGVLWRIGGDAARTFADEADMEGIYDDNSLDNVITAEMEQEFLDKLDERIQAARTQKQ